MIVSELYLAWSSLLLFQTWLEAHVLESCCSSLPWQIVSWSLLTNLPLPYPQSWAVLGVTGSSTTQPCVESGQLWHCCCVPGILVHQKQPKKIQHCFLSRHIHELKQMSPVMCVHYHFQNASAIQCTLHSCTDNVPVQLECAFLCFHICAPKHENIRTAWASSWELQFS